MTLEELNTFVTTQANVSMEAYYWWCTAFMVIIHVGFLMYEVCLLYTSDAADE